MLKTLNLNLTLNKQLILNSINIQVKPGERVAILGPNGAGKSSLIKSLSGDFSSVADLIELNNRKLTDYTSAELAQYRSVMPQSIQLDFPFLVNEVIEIGLPTHSDKTQRHICIKQALNQLDLTHLSQHNYLALSGGEQQRVQLARVISQLLFYQIHYQYSVKENSSHQFLLLDECTSNLDLAHQHQVFKLVSRLAKQYKIGVISVLHDLNLAAQYSDKLILMQQGKIVKQGRVEEVLTSQLITEVYNYPVTLIKHPKGWPIVLPLN